MASVYEVPGEGSFEIEHLLLDVNGTLTDRGRLLPGVIQRLGHLQCKLSIHLLSADTYGTLEELSRLLRVEATHVSSGMEKATWRVGSAASAARRSAMAATTPRCSPR